MEGLARLVAESFARHGMDAPLDHRRLEWSRWFRCESSLSLILAPSKPGLFALAEEVLAPGEAPATGGKRMLAVLDISPSDDLGLELGHRFAPSHPLKGRLASGQCYARYAVVEDAAQRQAACAALQQWLASAAETASGMGAGEFPGQVGTAFWVSPASRVQLTENAAPNPAPQEIISAPEPIPSGF